MSLARSAKLFSLMSIMTAIFVGTGIAIGGSQGAVLALVLAGVMNFGSYWYSDKITLRMHNAEKISGEKHAWVKDCVREISQEAGIPEPDVYKSSMPVPNAFATGRSPENGVVCITEGLLQNLDRDEARGVIAHEIAHIKNRDTLTNSIVATFAGGIAVLADFAFWGAMFSGREENGQLAAGLVTMIVTPLIAALVKSAVSRTMEYRADEDAVKLLEDEDGLVKALKKIESAASHSRYSSSRYSEASANMFIVNPFRGHKLTKYFSTHPPTDERIENMREIGKQY